MLNEARIVFLGFSFNVGHETSNNDDAPKKIRRSIVKREMLTRLTVIKFLFGRNYFYVLVKNANELNCRLRQVKNTFVES